MQIKNLALPLLLTIFCLSSCQLFKKSQKAKKDIAVTSIITDTARKIIPDTARKNPVSKIKPYAEIITAKAVTDVGLFTIHKLEERYFVEIPDMLLGRDILVVNRIAKAATDGRVQTLGYSGDQVNETVIRFEKGPNNKLFLKTVSYAERAGDTSENGMYRSVVNSNLLPITASFDIKTNKKDSVTNKELATVIELTDYLNGDNDVLFFNSQIKSALKLGAYHADKSYVVKIKSFPGNIEIKTTKTYMKVSAPSPLGGAVGGGNATYELNSSLVLLPKVAMTPRLADNRVGYFSRKFTDFDANQQGVKRVEMITRWRLEPKKEDRQKYFRGELVEPLKPIVLYIDPATPKKWIPYLKQGIDDWQEAFEKAGFKNAIQAREAPAEDSTWSLEDARHSAIVYKPSDIPNASGPHVHDPRSGEILETHVNWYHNVMSLLRNWYMIQVAATDSRARQMQFNDSLMGQLIRFVSSHEIGHALGLRHNFGASSTVPVDSLRSKAWVEKHGHTPSIMDYARFNYVAQPEDNISEAGLFPRIGDYDLWAIEWGYRLLPEAISAKEEEALLNKLIIERTSNNKRLWFGDGESKRNDPRCQTEDLGDNAVKASAYGIKNLQSILPELGKWTSQPNADYTDLETMYKELIGQFNRYLGHVVKNIGGYMTTPKTVEENGEIYAFVDKGIQQEAMRFLNEQLFTTPKWLVHKKYTGVIPNDPVAIINGLQNNILITLLNSGTFNQLLRAEVLFGNSTYTITDLFSDLQKGVWTELSVRRPIDIYRRNLQKNYAEKLVSFLNPPSSVAGTPLGVPPGIMMASVPISKSNDALSLVKHHTKQLATEIRVALNAATDSRTKIHLQDVLERLNDALNTKR